MINRSNNKLYFDYSVNLQLAFATKHRARIGYCASIHRCELSMDMELGLSINLACMN